MYSLPACMVDLEHVLQPLLHATLFNAFIKCLRGGLGVCPPSLCCSPLSSVHSLPACVVDLEYVLPASVACHFLRCTRYLPTWWTWSMSSNPLHTPLSSMHSLPAYLLHTSQHFCMHTSNKLLHLFRVLPIAHCTSVPNKFGNLVCETIPCS